MTNNMPALHKGAKEYELCQQSGVVEYPAHSISANPMPPLCKGRCLALQGETEGLLIVPIVNIIYTDSVGNPPVSFADSPLCTRGPKITNFVNGLPTPCCDKAGGFALFTAGHYEMVHSVAAFLHVAAHVHVLHVVPEYHCADHEQREGHVAGYAQFLNPFPSEMEVENELLFANTLSLLYAIRSRQ